MNAQLEVCHSNNDSYSKFVVEYSLPQRVIHDLKVAWLDDIKNISKLKPLI